MVSSSPPRPLRWIVFGRHWQERHRAGVAPSPPRQRRGTLATAAAALPPHRRRPPPPPRQRHLNNDNATARPLPLSGPAAARTSRPFNAAARPPPTAATALRSRC